MIAIVLILISARGSEVSTEADVHQAFWNTFKMTGSEVEGHASLSEMATQADTVVVSEFIDFAESRQIVGDAPEDVVTYAAATPSIKEVIRGNVTEDQLPVEFLLFQTPDQVNETIANLATQLPSGDMLLFLRHKDGPEESGLYRLVNSTGLWTATETGGFTALLTESLPADAVSEPVGNSQHDSETYPYADERTTIASFSELVNYVRN